MSTEAFPIVSWTIAGKNLKDFRVVYGEGVSADAATAFCKALEAATGCVITAVADVESAESTDEILIGSTNRAESTGIADPTYLNYTFGVVNGKLVIKTGGAHSLNRVIGNLVGILCEEGNTLALEEGYLLKGDLYDDPYDHSKPEGTDIRGISCNILAEWENYGGGDAPIVERKEVFFSMLDVYEPDVIGVQEVSPGWYEAFPDYRDWKNWSILKYPSPNVDDNVYSTVMYRSDRFELLDEGMHYYSKFNNRRCRCVTWALLKDKTSACIDWNQAREMGFAFNKNDETFLGKVCKRMQ